MNKSNQSGGVTVIIVVIVLLIVAAGVIYYVRGDSGAHQGEPTGIAATAAAGSAPPGSMPKTAVDSAPPATMAKPAPAEPRQASTPLPEGYPAGVVPLFDPSTVVHASAMGSGSSLQYVDVVESRASSDIVADSIAGHYKAQGASVNQIPLDEEGTGLTVVSKDGYNVLMTYGRADKLGYTSISYYVSPPGAAPPTGP